MVFSGAGRAIATITFDFDADDRITTIHNVANPDKLQTLADGTAHDISTNGPVCGIHPRPAARRCCWDRRTR
ncbi:hypothetical protein NCC78_09135 [Micromonospora phytophila]|uniref:hypothetical protein n=1 Tax=Micromonospora phytophila TaxID=709888 RepID=UPI0020304E14|nr:hypothetical protein [Micromonospora phytophila]MCM0674852.1 hypothetical protein [Micromonospora phytophila]